MLEMIEQRLLRRLRSLPSVEYLAVQAFGVLRPQVELPKYKHPSSILVPRQTSPEDTSTPVFLTARFRTGSTVLWQLFNAMVGYTAYYEPLNERRWFDPSRRGEKVDHSHRGVATYAANYDGLEHLDSFFSEEWTYRHIAMGMAARDNNLERYIAELIATARARPVLQFNRVDFRLPFLRARFPDAVVIHLRRNARDTWRSTLKGLPNEAGWQLQNFDTYCKFYLMPWYRDLMIAFPWLHQPGKTHPYLIHYLISRLSDLFAAEWAHYSLAYEQLCEDFPGETKRLMAFLGEDNDQGIASLKGLLVPRGQPYDHAADNDFYGELETQAERILKDHLPGI